MTTMFRIRKLTAFVLVAALWIGSLSVMAVAMPSDVNGDGAVNTADVRALLLALATERELTEDERVAADVDGDGVVNTVDARLLLMQSLVPTDPTSTGPMTSTTFASTRPTQTTTTYPTTTMPLTTTTTWVLTGPDGTAPTTFPTTTDTTMPDCDTTYTTTTYPTTMPYGSFTVTVDTVSARAGDTVTIPVKVSRDHALVGFEMDIVYDPSVLTLLEVNDEHRNPYATALHAAVFDDEAQWRFTQLYDGEVNVRYVSSADDGARDSGTLFALTFAVNDDTYVHATAVECWVTSYLCCANGTEYIPYVNTVSGAVKVASRTTRTTTSGTTDTTDPTTTDTTYPPTTTTTELIYWQTTTSGTTVPDCVSTPAPYPTTLPYGDPLCYTGETVMVRVGETFDWSIDLSARHSLVGLEMDVYYDPDVLTWIPEGTALNGAIFDDKAQWRISHIADGVITLRYVSGASTGDAIGGELLSFKFLLRHDTDADDTRIYISPTASLSAVNGFAYHAREGTITDGVVKVASRSTRPKTTTVGTTDTTYPPTTTTTWVLTGPDGTAPTTVWTTTTTPPTMTD